MRAGGYGQLNSTSPHQFSVEPYIKHYLSEAVLTPYVKGQLFVEIIKAGGPATDTYGGRLSAGLAYLLGRRFIIEAELAGLSSSYSEINSTVITGPNRWNIQLDATLRPNFVLSYVLR